MADPWADAPARTLSLVAIAVAVLALIGFGTGMSPSSYRAERPPPRTRPTTETALPARTHAELERNPWTGPPAETGWRRSVELAGMSFESADDMAASVGAALADRAALRAYDGAPPVVPHPIRASGASECLACHADGFVLGNRRARPIPHEAYASCTQCHVNASAPFTRVDGNAAAQVPSLWSGLVSPDRGEVAYVGAPPAVPHSTRMRERCEGCHGPGGRAALRTPHPGRLSCLQCHPATGSRAGQASR